jgi:type I restriction enzyme, S subunit
MENVRKFKIPLPPTFLEQKKIYETLSSIDDLINAQSQKVETLKLHKKGLLQSLFPTISD